MQTGWVATIDGNGRRYFYHPSTTQSTWTLPQGAVLDLDGTFRNKRGRLLEDLQVRLV